MCLTLFEADLAQCMVGDFVGGVESLATEWARESTLGVEIGEREGDVGGSGDSLRLAGVFLDCCCWGGMIWAGRWNGAGDFSFFPFGCCYEGVEV